MTEYKLGKKIARGGMAEIFMATKIMPDSTKQLFCVKRILPHYANDEEFIQMFRDEAKICQNFSHANLVAVHDFTEIDGAWAIIMDLVSGSDLRAIFAACEKQSTRLSVQMICYIIAEAAKGLQHAHNVTDKITGKHLGVVHRDISPQNILISFDGETKVTDFGIAEADSKLNETKPGIVKGKYSYMSPEQIMAKPVDHRTDIFALGIVLWEALGMKRLFQGINEVETIQLVKNCKIKKDLKELNPNVDDILMNIVNKALKKDLKERYQSCSDLEQDLRRYIASTDPNFSKLHLADFVQEVLKVKYEESKENIRQIMEQDAPEGDIKSPKTTDKNAPNVNPKSSSDKKKNDLTLPPLPELDAPIELKVSKVNLPVIDDDCEATMLDNLRPPESDELTGRLPKLEDESSAIMHGASDVFSQNRSDGAPEIKSGSLNLSSQSKSTLADTKSKEAGAKSSTPAWAAQSASNNAHGVSRGLPSSSTLIQVVALVCLMVASGGGYYYYLKSKPTSQNIDIEFSPKRAKIQINGQYISNNYLASPYTVADMPLGDHEIVLSREGFSDQRIYVTLNGKKPSKTVKLALARSARIAPVEIRLSKDSAPERVNFKFTQNLDSGVVTKSQPKRVSDLVYGRSYKLFISGSRISFACRITPRSISWTKPYIVFIFPDSKKCKISSPKPKK